MFVNVRMAWEYLRFYWGRTVILIAALTLIIALPIISRLMLGRFERQAHLRAESTPLVIGAKGSRFGLVMHTLYFRGESPEDIPIAEQERVHDMGYAKTIPLHIKYSARGVPVVGTSEDYFEFRKLALEQGQPLRRLGDCVLGAGASKKLNLRPGDFLVTDPENSFDLSGPSPLKMRVVGLLASNGTADDDVVWCDLKTAWIIQGIGHGHSVAGQQSDQTHLHSASSQNLQVYQEVTDDNEQTFHFHGRRNEYPLTAIIAIPNSMKSETLLMGEYLGPGQRLQIVRPVESIAELMVVISRVRSLFDFGLGFLILVAVLLLILVLLLSLRLRQPEIRTLQLLGCSRGITLSLIATEWVMLFLAGLLLASLLAAIAAMISDAFLIRMI